MKRTTKTKPAKKAAVGRVMWHNHNDPSGPVINGSNYGNPKSRPVLVIDLSDAKAYEEAVRKGALRIGKRAHKEAIDQTVPGGAVIVRKLEADDLKFYSKYAAEVLSALGWPSPSVSAKPKNANKAKVRYPVEFENAEQGDEG